MFLQWLKCSKIHTALLEYYQNNDMVFIVNNEFLCNCAIVQLKLRRYHKSTRDLLTAISQVDETVKSY